MAMDPEELVTLKDHGTMKLRAAVVRAMILSAKERKRATIVREGEPAILNFKQIRNLGAKWDERRGSSARGHCVPGGQLGRDQFTFVSGFIIGMTPPGCGENGFGCFNRRPRHCQRERLHSRQDR